MTTAGEPTLYQYRMRAGWVQPSDDMIQIARDIEAMKRDCGPDPESATAIYNGRLMGISCRIRALAAVQGKK